MRQLIRRLGNVGFIAVSRLAPRYNDAGWFNL
jgi:hypothetical protein